MSDTQLVEKTTPAVNTAAKKKRARKRMRSILIAVLAVLILAGAAFAVWWFIFRDKSADQKILSDFASRSSIASMVSGSGSAKADRSETISLGAAGTVLEVYVKVGDAVNEGDPLYVIDSPAANKALTDAEARVVQRTEAVGLAQKRLTEVYGELAELQKSQAQSESDRFLKAPFAGQMRGAATLAVGDAVTKGTKIVQLVDDRKLKLSLYFSYAFEQAIFVGQAAQISVSGGMSNLAGKVEEIHRVRRVTPEGATLFEVVLVLDNPGALTDGMAASASLTAADGTAIYPYEGGALAFYRTFELNAKTNGDVEQTRLLNYGDCAEGETLVVLSPEDFSPALQAKRDELKVAEEGITAAAALLDEAQQEVVRAIETIAGFSASAPMTGTILSCSLRPGEEVESGRAAVTIADIAMMTVDINVDERNVSYIKPGMGIQLNDWYQHSYYGEVVSVSMTGQNENGITFFPVVVRVENYAGTLMTGMMLDYQFTAAQSEDCIVIPIQCVRYVPGEDGTNREVVFLKADTKPENALDLPPDIAKNFPEGFYAVPVVTGLSDNMNVEVKEGLDEGAEIFNNYYTDQSSGWGGGYYG